MDIEEKLQARVRAEGARFINRFGDLRLEILRREDRLMSEQETLDMIDAEDAWPDVIGE